jgi:hypothetical protein
MIIMRKNFQPQLKDVLFSHQTTVNKKNLGGPDQVRGGGFMVGWKTMSTNHVDFELTSTDKSFKCKSTLVLLTVGKVTSPQKPNEHNAKMGREYLQGVKQEWQFHNFHMEICGSQYKPQLSSHWRLRVCHPVSCLHHFSCSEKPEQ